MLEDNTQAAASHEVSSANRTDTLATLTSREARREARSEGARGRADKDVSDESRL